jgi:hypothetical protein
VAHPNIITDEAKAYIVDNCQLTSIQLKKDIKEKFGVDVSEVAVWEHMKKARDRAELATKTVDTHISKRIAEHVDNFVDTIMERYQKEIIRTGKILDGECEDGFEIGPDKDDDSRKSSYWYNVFVKQFTTLAKDYMALRPQFPTLEITGKSEEEIKKMYLDACDEETIAVLENLARKVEEVQK